MKYILLAITLSFSFNSHALTWKVFGACSNSPVHQGEVSADLTKSVGAITVDIFNENKIPFVGAAEGMNSILNTPIGLEAMEVVSDNEARVYGWCYSVNGKSPVQMPHEIKFLKQTDELIWYYAYSTNKNNEWTDYCSPAYWIKAIQFCGR